MDRDEILRACSPEFQAKVKRERDEIALRLAAQQEEQIQIARAKEQNEAFWETLLSIGAWIGVGLLMLAVVYSFIKFVKWAWYN